MGREAVIKCRSSTWRDHRSRRSDCGSPHRVGVVGPVRLLLQAPPLLGDTTLAVSVSGAVGGEVEA